MHFIVPPSVGGVFIEPKPRRLKSSTCGPEARLIGFGLHFSPTRITPWTSNHRTQLATSRVSRVHGVI